MNRHTSLVYSRRLLLAVSAGIAAVPVARAAELNLARSEEAVALPRVDVVATATRTSRDVQRLPVRAEVLDEHEIAGMAAATLADVLRAEPSITFQAGGSFGPARVAPSMRGAAPNATLLLVDGRRLAGEVGNPFELGRILVGAIERVEIVEGPLGTLYGADAIGGVINVVTHRPTEEHAAGEPALAGTIGMLGGAAIDGGGDWRPHERVQLGARARHVGEQAYQAGKDARTDAFTVVDFSLLLRLDRHRRWELQLGLENAFDAPVDKTLGADPGPYVRAGIRHTF